VRGNATFSVAHLRVTGGRAVPELEMLIGQDTEPRLPVGRTLPQLAEHDAADGGR